MRHTKRGYRLGGHSSHKAPSGAKLPTYPLVRRRPRYTFVFRLSSPLVEGIVQLHHPLARWAQCCIPRFLLVHLRDTLILVVRYWDLLLLRWV